MNLFEDISPGERPRLSLPPIAQTVHADLAHQQRSLARDVLKTREIGLETILRLEIDVETGEVEKGQAQVLGRRIVGVRHETRGIRGFRDSIQPL